MSSVLMGNLKKRQINACGIVTTTRKNLSIFAASGNEKKGKHETLNNTGITVTKWIHNKEVHILSNFYHPNQTV